MHESATLLLTCKGEIIHKTKSRVHAKPKQPAFLSFIPVLLMFLITNL